MTNAPIRPLRRKDLRSATLNMGYCSSMTTRKPTLKTFWYGA